MIRTGIGGWTYPDWRGGVFYPKGLRQADELRFAAEHLGAIEVNGTFYRLQKPETFADWRRQVPDGFVFALKGSRYIGTRRVLAEAEEAVARFVDQGIAELGDALGPICWQLPKTKRFDADDIAAFFGLLPRETAGLPLRHAIEVQHESFDCEAFVALARQAKIAIVYLDAPDMPAIDAATADFSYARFKTAQADIAQGYADTALDAMAGQLKHWSKGKRDVFAFAINGAKERAPAAAMALASRIAS